MKSVDATEARARLDEILETAQHQAIAITRERQEVAVMVSIGEYERLRAFDIENFLGLRRQVAREAAANGLTEQGSLPCLAVPERREPY